MINFKESIAEKLSEIIEGLNKDEIMAMLEVPTDSKLGDYAFLFPCNVMKNHRH